MVHLRLSYAVSMNGRGVRKRIFSAADLKPFHERPAELRHDFEDDFAHLASGLDVGLTKKSTVAAPLYTLIDRKAWWVKADTWAWGYKGR